MSYYYLNRDKSKIIVIDGDEAPVTDTEVSMMYSYYPESLESDTEEPEIPDMYHLALVHGTISKLFGDAHHDAMYRRLIARARSSSKNSAFANLAQYDY